MPSLSAWTIRLALLHLAAGLTIGSLMLANKGQPFAPTLWRWVPAHAEFLLIGWTAQLALAVAHWIIPRFRGGNFGRLQLARLSIIFLNAGVLLVALTPILSLPAVVGFAGRILEGLAALLFALYIWPRIRPQGR
ncbi:MAG: hypothetical protein ACOC9E_01315 [Chloroflexota bacterium]